MKPFLISSDFDLVRLKTSNNEYVFSSDNLAIYVRDASPTVPSDTGIGVLAEASSCTVKYGPDGYDELELEYPATGRLYSKLKLRDIIVAKVGKRGNQPYRIYRITKPIDFKIKIYARHLAYDLMGIVVKPFSAANIKGALSGLKANAMTNCPFNFSTERTTAVPFEVKRPTSIWSLMSSGQDGLLDVYGGEYLFNGYSVKFEKELGETTGVSVTYGINMTDFEQDSNCENCHTGVVGYWEENDEVIYSPVIGVSGNYDYVNIMTVDLTQYWTERPSQSELRSVINTYIQNNKIGVPKVSWTINFIPLGMTEEYKNVAALEHVSIGDTVDVIFEKLGVKATARVTEIVWDVLLDRYKSVSLGDVKNSVARTISGQTTTINNLPTKEKTKSLIKQISTALSESILGANGGSVRFIDTNKDGMPDTLYIADNPDPNLAVKVWRFNYEGWAASENGYNGPFKMGATLDSGLMADFITAGVLNANLIKVISSGDVGGGYGDCSMEFDGQFIKGTHDDSGNPTVQIGSQVDTSGNITYVHGDMKMYSVRNYQGQTTFKRIIWLGGETGANGLVIDSPDDSAKIALIYSPDIGMIISMDDYDGNRIFSLAEDGSGGTLRMNNGTIRCKSLIVNDRNIDWTSKGSSISSGTNILTLSPGRYYCETDDIAASLVHCPTTSNFSLFVFDRNSSVDRKNMILIDKNNDVYTIAQTGTLTYTSWRKLSYTSV